MASLIFKEQIVAIKISFSRQVKEFVKNHPTFVFYDTDYSCRIHKETKEKLFGFIPYTKTKELLI